MLRKPVVVFALLFSSLVPQLNAIGLGSAFVESGPNEPLRAKVRIFDLGETPLQEVSPQIASLADLQRLNIDLNPSLADPSLSVAPNQQDAYLSLTSSEAPVRSNLHLVLNIMWPEGRSLGKYATSLDTALFGDKQQVVNITHSLRENALGQNFDSEILTISPADTLWSLALRLRPDVSVTIQQTMLAIQNQNPEAFRDNNVNRMLSGQVLRIPTLSQIQENTPGDAFNEISRQNQIIAHAQPRALSQQVASNQTTVQQGQLGVATSNANNNLIRDNLGALAEENSELDRRIEELEAQLALSQEEMDRTLIQREELSSRLADLESQIESAQETIRLQDFQLAQLFAAAQTAVSGVNGLGIATEPPETSLTEKVRNIFAPYGLFVFGALLLISVFVSFLVRRNNIASTGHDLASEVEEELPATLTANEASLDKSAPGVNDFISIGVEDQEQEIAFSPGRPVTDPVEDSGFKKEEEEGDHIDFVVTKTEQDAFDNLGFLSDEDKEEIDSVGDVDEIFRLSDEEIATKLELAYAYQKMGDVEGAIEILQEVIKEGNLEQVKEAKKLVSSFDTKLG